LRSIAAQTLLPRQVVVIAEGDDGASVRALVEGSFSGPAAAVEVIANPVAVGRSAALNQGLAAARTTWIAILDDDDTWDPAFLTEMLAVAGARAGNEWFGGVVCRTEAVYERISAAGVEILEKEPFNPSLTEVRLSALVRANQFTIHAALWHRRVAERLGGFRDDLHMLEDWEFNVRVALEFTIIVLPRMLAHYHLRPPDDRAPNSGAEDLDRMARTLRAEWRRAGWANRSDEGFVAGLLVELRHRWRRRRSKARWKKRLS